MAGHTKKKNLKQPVKNQMGWETTSPMNLLLPSDLPIRAAHLHAGAGLQSSLVGREPRLSIRSFDPGVSGGRIWMRLWDASRSDFWEKARLVRK